MIRRSLAVLVLFAFFGVAKGSDWEPPKGTVTTLVTRLRAQLPQGWSFSFDEKKSWIEIERIKPELMLNVVPNLSGEEKSTSQKYILGLTIVSFVPKDEYEKLRSENEATETKMDTLQKTLTHSRPFWGWPGAFKPANEEEKREFEEYKQLDASLHRLPDFYFEDLSLELEPDTLRLDDDTIQKECEDVRQKVVRTLSAY